MLRKHAGARRFAPTSGELAYLTPEAKARVISQEIVDDLEVALAEFSAVAESLGEKP